MNHPNLTPTRGNVNRNSATPLLDHLKERARKRPPALLVLLLAITVGTAWFLYLYSYRALVFSNVNWIYNAGGDALQHYLGWLFYRDSPWAFPLGKITHYAYPFGINLAYTDSIPLLSIPLKLLSPLLQPRFQFFGFWVLFNIIAQVFFTLLILRRYTTSLIHQLIGGSLLVLAPIMLLRAWGHSSLNAHWLLLASIYLVLAGREKAHPLWVWPALFCLELLSNPYFLPMSGVLFAVYLLEALRRDRRIRPALLAILTAGVSVLAAGLLSGSIDPSLETAPAWGYGYYSFNLNALFNPLRSTSAFFDPRPLNIDFQWEGYNYLGAGYFLLALAGLGWLVFSRRRTAWLRTNGFLIAGCLLLTLFAVTNRVTFDDKLLLEIPFAQGFSDSLGVFRSSGRFFWPVTYLIVLGGILAASRAGRWSWAFLALALLLQFLDLAPMRGERGNFVFARYQSPLDAPFWQEAAESFRHIELLPANQLIGLYEPFAIYAAEQKMTLNWGYFARADYAAIYDHGLESVEQLRAGDVPEDTLYLFCNLSDVHAIQRENAHGNLAFYRINGYLLGLPTANPATQHLSAGDQASEQAILDERLAHFIASANQHTLFVLSGRGASFTDMDAETRSLLQRLGLKADLDESTEDGYVAIFGQPLGGQTFELRSAGSAAADFHAGEQNEDLVLPFDLHLLSSSPAEQNLSSIRLNGVEYSSNRYGINILAYDTSNGAITAKNFNRLYPVICP